MANKEPWRAGYNQSLAKIEALCANKNVMSEICGRTSNAGEADSEERYQKNIDATLKGWAKNYTDKAWSL